MVKIIKSERIGLLLLLKYWVNTCFYIVCMKLLYFRENVAVPITWWLVICLHSVFGVWHKTRTKHSVFVWKYFITLLSFKKPSLNGHRFSPPTVINTCHGFAEESIGKTLTYYICSLIQFGKELEKYKNIVDNSANPSISLSVYWRLWCMQYG